MIFEILLLLHHQESDAKHYDLINKHEQLRPVIRTAPGTIGFLYKINYEKRWGQMNELKTMGFIISHGFHQGMVPDHLLVPYECRGEGLNPSQVNLVILPYTFLVILILSSSSNLYEK
jgi:hypothetical protein